MKRGCDGERIKLRNGRVQVELGGKERKARSNEMQRHEENKTKKKE